MRIRGFVAVSAAIWMGMFNPSAWADAPTEKDARAAFVRLVEVAKHRQLAQFKQMVAKTDLAEMEAMEKERAGLFDMMMLMVAADDPKGFKGEVKGDRATFVKQVSTKDASGTSKETTKVTLVREDGRWKFGKHRD